MFCKYIYHQELYCFLSSKNYIWLVFFIFSIHFLKSFSYINRHHG